MSKDKKFMSKTSNITIRNSKLQINNQVERVRTMDPQTMGAGVPEMRLERCWERRRNKELR